MKLDKMIETLENSYCDDPFECPFGMYGQNEDGCYGCFARFPNGDPDEEDQGCVAQQAAKILKAMKTTIHCLTDDVEGE